MKAISLWQPWASFMAWGIKKIETRHWPLPKSINGPIAIHAAKKLVRVNDWYFNEALLERNLSYNDLPSGFILCYFDFVKCVKINSENIPAYPERAFGNYLPGRFMWIMEGLHVLPCPIMIRGSQGIWNWENEINAKKRIEKERQQLKLF